MTTLKQKKWFKKYSGYLRNGGELSAEVRDFLADVFDGLAMGEDANKVFGLGHRIGHSDYDDLKRQQLSLALHWVAGATQPKDEAGTGLGLSVTDACKEASKLLAIGFKYKGRKIILDSEYLRQCWYKKKLMQKTDRQTDDLDFPYDH